MSITIGDKPEQNVVNVGDELTADQLAALQNAQGASATNPVLTRTNTFNTTDAAVRITQEGTGEAFRVEDAASPDSSPFVITSDGNVGIGTASISAKLVVNGGAILSGVSGGSLYNFTQNGTGALAVFANNATSTADCVRITNLGTGNSFVVEDEANPDATPFAISAAGDVAIGSGSFNGKLRVTGRSYFENTSGSGGNAVLWVRSTVATSVPVGQFSSDSAHSGPTLVVSNQGTGNSFVVEDSASDTTTFVIDNAGNVTLGGSLTLASGALNLSVGTQTYPHELTFIVGSTTYRVPARSI